VKAHLFRSKYNKNNKTWMRGTIKNSSQIWTHKCSTDGAKFKDSYKIMRLIDQG
jgi:hypothetical protein